MTRHYCDYLWKNGKPYGIRPVEGAPAGTTYKVVSDPYGKRLSVEKYRDAEFCRVVYDSALFDFRSLKPAEQTAWQKTPLPANGDKVRCAIRNQDDRLILIEEYEFDGTYCRGCRSTTPHGMLVAIQKMHYTELNDAFDGVVLYDSDARPVVYKRYAVDPLTKEFAELIEEEWDMASAKAHSLLATTSPQGAWS